jgi:hypothetical protein
VLSGGYAQKFDAQTGWQQITGSRAKFSKQVAQAPEGSRRERRARQWHRALELSEVQWGTR